MINPSQTELPTSPPGLPPVDGHAPRAVRICPTFDPRRCVADLTFAHLLQWGIVIAAGLSFLFASLFGGGALGASAPLIVLVGLWLFLSAFNARAFRQMAEVTALIEIDPELAEQRLAELFKQRFHYRGVRALVYHRLALLRFRQGIFAETAAITRTLLDQSLPRPAHNIRVHLLLMNVDASLQIGDLVGAFQGLMTLRTQRLGFVEQLQCLSLQTRYEMMVGAHAAALSNLPHKIALAELMPASQCGMLHTMFAIAAERLQQPAIAAWLRQRAELLATPQEIEVVERALGRG